jgi:dTDP-4-dehydrorhamnose reductase
MIVGAEERSEVWANVVSYNRLPMLQQCIGALRDQSKALARIIVVDNGSQDGSAEWLRQEMDEQLVLIEQGNLGSAGGQFAGIKAAYEAGAEWIWLMDDDVVPEPDALEKLLEATQLEREAGLFCSRVTDASGKIEVNTPIFAQEPPRRGYYPQWTRTLAAGLVPIERSTFVSCFVRADVLPEVGFPLAEFFIWHDDFEFTRRITKRYPGYLVARSVVRHLRADVRRLSYKNELDASRIGMLYYFFRNKVALLKREADSKVNAVFKCALFYFMTLGGILLYQPKLRLLVVLHRGFFAGVKFAPKEIKPEPRDVHRPVRVRSQFQ